MDVVVCGRGNILTEGRVYVCVCVNVCACLLIFEVTKLY